MSALRRMVDPAIRRMHDDMGNAPELLSPVDHQRVFGERPTWFRAAGACLCVCGEQYNDHPSVVGALWLTRLCDDELVKL